MKKLLIILIKYRSPNLNLGWLVWCCAQQMMLSAIGGLSSCPCLSSLYSSSLAPPTVLVPTASATNKAITYLLYYTPPLYLWFLMNYNNIISDICD